MTPDPQPPGREPQTSMMLTQQEWDDLAEVARAYVITVQFSSTAASHRRTELCQRIIEANR